MQRWEYTRIHVYNDDTTEGHGPKEHLDEVLTRLGNEGWELVGTLSSTSTMGAARITTGSLFFKRPKDQDQ